MIGAIICKLRALKNGRIPETNGRLMHGAFFALLHQLSPSLAKSIHDESGLKPFTVSELTLAQKRKQNTHCLIKKGDGTSWRITLLHELLLRVILSAPTGTVIDIGGIPFSLEAIIADSSQCPDAGILEEDDLIAACLSEQNIHEITLQFQSPTTFRTDTSDYPLPLPALVFSSLCEKWNLSSMSLQLPAPDITTIASRIIPSAWRGQSKRVFFGHDRGVRAFTGSFTYDLSALDLEHRQLILLLAQFATFSGVGRLTAQGFGRTTATYK